MELAMVKHKLKVGLFFGTKRMKFKTKHIDVEIQLVLLDQIHFPVYMYITMWAAKK